MVPLTKGAKTLLKTYKRLLKIQNIKNKDTFNKKIITDCHILKLETGYSYPALRKFNFELEKYGYIKRILKNSYTEDGKILRNKLEIEIY